jgi:uncharacterized membrane protein YphA (DoxX/SURF4 family)
MENKYLSTFKIALFFVRSLLGLILFWQGFGKIFTWGLSNVYANVFKSYEDLGLPEALLKAVLYFTSYGELIVGFVLMLGLFRKWAYYILISILLVVAFGHGLKDPIWDLSHVFFRAALLFPLLILPLSADKICLDKFRE